MTPHGPLACLDGAMVSAICIESAGGGSISTTGSWNGPSFDTKKALEACMTLLAYLAIESAEEHIQTRTHQNTLVVFFRGVTYYDGLRTQEEGFNAEDILNKRQEGRAMIPGLYTSRNKHVAEYFAYFNSDPFLGSPGQGGAALLTITLSQKKFQELSTLLIKFPYIFRFLD